MAVASPDPHRARVTPGATAGAASQPPQKELQLSARGGSPQQGPHKDSAATPLSVAADPAVELAAAAATGDAAAQ